MIEKIHIKNFKSIYDLEIEIGRVNLFIGENGSGKSNILESLVFFSATESNKLNNEFLTSRGLRVSDPSLMRSAFDEKDCDKNIEIELRFDNNNIQKYELINTNETPYSKWHDINVSEKNKLQLELLNNKDFQKAINNVLENRIKKEITEEINKNFIGKAKKQAEKKIQQLIKEKIKEKIDDFSINQINKQFKLENFLIYSPENTALRNFYKEGQIEPLGINGEGLFKLLKVINNYDDKNYIETIIKSLQLFNWFEDIKIPDNLSLTEDKVKIRDKYLYKEIDQRSANEGFLFILFYIALIVAKETPKSFAIDNIDASLNPKLCTKLMSILIELAHKYDKQIFLTTHNPAILDGINLNDNTERIFVVSRNNLGHTQMKQLTVKDNPVDEDGESLHLSEAFLRGYLGGLPRGF